MRAPRAVLAPAVADAGLAPVQAVIRWDPVGFADEELNQRGELGFPPAVTMASVDGARDTVSAFVDAMALPPTGELLGPVPLPVGVRPPAGSGDAFDGAVERILVRVPRRDGRQLSAALTAAQVHRNAQHETGPIRVQVDPPTIG